MHHRFPDCAKAYPGYELGAAIRSPDEIRGAVAGINLIPGLHPGYRAALGELTDFRLIQLGDQLGFGLAQTTGLGQVVDAGA